MFDIELAKLPPPKPARAAMSRGTPNGVAGFDAAMASPMLGMRSRAAETIVQLRLPKRGTMNV